LSNSPMGKYTIAIQKRYINHSEFSDSEIIKYKAIGGPSNMLLSIMIPGLGVKPVTGGTKTGIKRTLLTYGLIATGFAFKGHSISEYEKYQQATTQKNMDYHYDNANASNHFFYAFAGAGVIYWIYDIVWVTNKGFKNRESQKKYRMDLAYNPIGREVNVSYSLKF
jgi:hypothetical protein